MAATQQKQASDRVFLYINGAPLSDILSGEITINLNSKEVNTMTVDGWPGAFVMGNKSGELSLTMAMLASESAPFLVNQTWGSTVQSTVVFGAYGVDTTNATQYILTGLFLKNDNAGSQSTGSESQKKLTFGFLRASDPIGVSSQLLGAF